MVKQKKEKKEKSEKQKKEKSIFLRALLFVIVIILINAGLIYYKYGPRSFSGFSISGGISEVYSSIPSTSKIFLIVQYGVLFLILLFVFIKDRGLKKINKKINEVELKRMSKDSKTDLDTLYNLLKEKKELEISTIARTFNIKEELAMDWCKILESGNLIEIDYPGFRKPTAKIK